MGLFDLRCGLSGMSTSWPGMVDDEYVSHTCSMLLVEKREKHWVPLSPPVSGCYDRYGRIELWRSHQNEHTRWVERELERMHSSGSLSFANDAELDALRRRSAADSHGTILPLYLALAAGALFDGLPVTMDGREVRPAIVLDDVAAAVASAPKLPRPPDEEALLARLARRSALGDDTDLELEYAAWLDAQSRPIHATYLRAQHERRRRGFLAHPPAASVPGIERLHRVLHWAEARGGLGPIKPRETGQDGESDVRHLAHGAWKSGDPTLRRVIESRRPAWVARWTRDDQARAVKATTEAPVPTDTPSTPYSPSQRFAVGEVIAHKVFGLGRVEAIEAGKMRVRFGADVKVLAQAG